ncbi:MAG: replicative DNA helicase [Ignavibacteriae bacterium]|nr:replicative DNA helicase [Ignavibacteriota bacterium]
MDYSDQMPVPSGKRKDSREGNMNVPMHYDTLIGKIPPHSMDAEMAVLGAMLLDRAAIPKVIEILKPEAFYKESHRIMYDAMLKLFTKAVNVDITTLAEELRRLGVLEQIGGTYAVIEVTSMVPTAANVEYYARIVLERYIKRSLISVAGEILVHAYDETTDALEEVDSAESKIFQIAEQRLGKSFMTMKEIAHDTFNMLMKFNEQDSKSGITGLASGFTKLDDMLGGFQDSDLVIIAARPSMGKTAFALSIARNIAVEFKQPVAFFSIEMAANQLMIRLLSAEARVNAHDMRTNRIQKSDMAKISSSIDVLSESPLLIDDSATLTVMEIRAKCRRLKAEHDIKIIIVDYLQFVSPPKAESREREISVISRSLKQIAKELNIPVIALSQLNRGVETRADKRPMLSDLRESGSIEQDADVVMFVNRPEQYGIRTWEDGSSTEGTAEIIIAKQRNGPVGDIRLAYLKSFARFENLSIQFDEPPGFIGSGTALDDIDF